MTDKNAAVRAAQERAAAAQAKVDAAAKALVATGDKLTRMRAQEAEATARVVMAAPGSSAFDAAARERADCRARAEALSVHEERAKAALESLKALAVSADAEANEVELADLKATVRRLDAEVVKLLAEVDRKARQSVIHVKQLVARGLELEQAIRKARGQPPRPSHLGADYFGSGLPLCDENDGIEFLERLVSSVDGREVRGVFIQGGPAR